MEIQKKIDNNIFDDSKEINNIESKQKKNTLKSSEQSLESQTEETSKSQPEKQPLECYTEEQPESPPEEQPSESPPEEQPSESQSEEQPENSNENSSADSTPNNQTETDSSEKMCRICYDDQKDEKLISPCKCSGSVKWVHQSCLQKWIDISHKKECSTCKYKYQYQKKYKRNFYKHLDHSYVPKLVTVVFILLTTILSGLISKLLMKLLKFNNNIKIGFNVNYLFFSLKYFSLLFFISLPILHYLKIINIREIYTNYISLYERNNTIYGQGVSDISIFIYLTIYKFFEKKINKLTESEKVIIDYIPQKK